MNLHWNFTRGLLAAAMLNPAHRDQDGEDALDGLTASA